MYDYNWQLLLFGNAWDKSTIMALATNKQSSIRMPICTCDGIETPLNVIPIMATCGLINFYIGEQLILRLFDIENIY